MKREAFFQSVRAALPICIGYVALGVPCGILGAKAGMSVLQIFLLSVFLYSGSGQFMIASMFIAGVSPLSIAVSVTLVSSRQLLYGSALSRYFEGVGKRRIATFAACVTDESFGVNLARFQAGGWTSAQAHVVNLASQTSWILSNTAGALLGCMIVVDTKLAAFAMTSIFICLLMMQKMDQDHEVAAFAAVGGVIVCKMLGFSGVAILIGAITGVVAGLASHSVRVRRIRSWNESPRPENTAIQKCQRMREDDDDVVE